MAREIPRQISIEDTYLHLHDLKAVRQQLVQLSSSLVKRMRIDLTEFEQASAEEAQEASAALSHVADREDSRSQNGGPRVNGQRRWLAHAKTIRLSTRERKPVRSFARISRSGTMPNFVFSLTEPLQSIAVRLAEDVLLPIWSKLIPAQTGFDVNLINIAATNLVETAGERESASGRDIGKMFKTQDMVLSEWRVEDPDAPPYPDNSSAEREALTSIGPTSEPKDVSDLSKGHADEVNDRRSNERVQDGAFQQHGSEDQPCPSQLSTRTTQDAWEIDAEDESSLGQPCGICGATMPYFALDAHMRFHLESD